MALLANAGDRYMLSMFTAMDYCSFQELLVDRTTTEQRYLCIHISIYLSKMNSQEYFHVYVHA